jgi:hypothetical protein
MRVKVTMRKLLFVCGLCLFISGAAFSQTTDRERDGLKGPVKMVRVRQAEKGSEDANESQSPLALVHEVTYDQTGNRTEIALYDPAGNLSRRIKYLYGPDGKTKLGLITYNAQNVMVRQVTDRYGSNGVKIHSTIQTYNEDGTLYKRTEIALSPLGELVDVTEYGPDGSPIKNDKAAVTTADDEIVVPSNPKRAEATDRLVSFGYYNGEYFDPDPHGNWTRGMTGSTERKYASGKKVKSAIWTYREFIYY